MFSYLSEAIYNYDLVYLLSIYKKGVCKKTHLIPASCTYNVQCTVLTRTVHMYTYGIC